MKTHRFLFIVPGLMITLSVQLYAQEVQQKPSPDKRQLNPVIMKGIELYKQQDYR
jgi:hypothetical protein